MLQTLFLLAAALVWAENPNPFSWLDKGDDPKVLGWMMDQHRNTREILKDNGFAPREKIEAHLRGGIIAGAAHRGSKTFYLRRQGEQNQPALMVRIGLGPAETLFDPNLPHPDGSVAVDVWEPSHDGLLLAYALAGDGRSDGLLRVREVDSATDLPDRIPAEPRAGVAWLKNREGFYYVRPPQAPPRQRDRGLYLHLLGEDTLKDQLIFEAPSTEDRMEPETSPDGRFLLVTVFKGLSRSEIYLRDFEAAPDTFTAVVKDSRFFYEARLAGESILLRTNEDAPRYKVMSVNLRWRFKVYGAARRATDPRHRDHWRTIVPESPDLIAALAPAGKHVAVESVERGVSRLKIYTSEGRAVREVPLPLSGVVSAFDGNAGSTQIPLVFESYLDPPALFNFDVETSSLTRLETAETTTDLTEFERTEVIVPVPDGEDYPMILLHKKRLRRNRDNPVLLAAHEGFDAPGMPTFSRDILLWLERGGIYAIPELRGRLPEGRAEGIAERDKTFTAFLASARWLIDKEYTRPQRLAVLGDTSGSLLADAFIQRAPELAAAAVLRTPAFDPDHFHRFRCRLWRAVENGSPDLPEVKRWLAPFTVINATPKRTPRPPALFLVRLGDGAEVQGHARKFAAFLQRDAAPKDRALLRLAASASPGGVAAIGHSVEEALDAYSFLFWKLGM